MIYRIIGVSIIILLLELYFYNSITTLLKSSSERIKKKVKWVYLSFTFLLIIFVLAAIIIPFKDWPKIIRVYLSSFIFIIMISKLIGSIFLLADDLIRLVKMIYKWFRQIFKINHKDSDDVNEKISRQKFFSIAGVIFSTFTFAPLFYGMVKGAFSYKIRTEKLSFPNLPISFKGLKIIQISDIHTGSFISTEPLTKAIELIQAQNADLIFFTGDLVNDKTEEVIPFLDILSKIKAPMGVYSILGNHDYGDYPRWDSKEEKLENFHQMIETHKKLGWHLLRNENIILEKGNDKIALIGVENWGGKLGFPKYGNIDKAISGTEDYIFKILLSHDPTHWDMKIKEHYPDIDLTLSGHTHGMQFGVEIPGFRWSPSQYIFKQWAGLYKHNSQYIYVNRGLGFLGYAGRVGILPEITVIELT